MPRNLPPLAGGLALEIKKASDLISRIEKARVFLAAHPASPTSLHFSNAEFLYELAYLQIFNSWENFLEETFVRFLCGYRHSGGQETLVNPGYYPRLVQAENAVLSGRNFVPWHNPDAVINRARRFFTNGRHEQVLLSNLTRLKYFVAIRHRIAHAQKHAKAEFDNATMNLNSKRYLGSHAGKFLRDWHPVVIPRQRWIDVISDELASLAQQIS